MGEPGAVDASDVAIEDSHGEDSVSRGHRDLEVQRRLAQSDETGPVGDRQEPGVGRATTRQTVVQLRGGRAGATVAIAHISATARRACSEPLISKNTIRSLLIPSPP